VPTGSDTASRLNINCTHFYLIYCCARVPTRIPHLRFLLLPPPRQALNPRSQSQELPVSVKARAASKSLALDPDFSLICGPAAGIPHVLLLASMSASPKDQSSRNASPAPRQGVSPLLLPIRAGSLSQEEPRRSSIQFLAHRNSSLPRGSPKPKQRRRLSSPPPPP
jgi:hypothetical protein